MKWRVLALVASALVWVGCGGSQDGDTGSGSSGGSTGSSSSSSGSTGSSSSGTSGSTGSGSSSGSSGSSSGGSSGGNIFQIVSCDDSPSDPCGTSVLGIDSATVLANPHSAISAGVAVTSHGANRLLVLYQPTGGAVAETPGFTVQQGGQLLPVLGLRPQTDYAIQVLATDGNGNYARSHVLGFTSGALPANAQESFSVSRSGNVPPGYIIAAKLTGNPAQTPFPALILDRSGRVVWYAETASSLYGDFKKQPNDTYTVGAYAPPANSATFNVSYQQFDPLGDPLGFYSIPDFDGGPENDGTDNHEFTILAGGDVLMIGNTSRIMDTSMFDGGTSTQVVEQTLWRVHPDGGIAFQWSAFDHTNLADMSPTFANRANNPLDATHLNAFSVAPDGNYITSLRHMSQVLKLDAQTGDVIWRLGENGDFTFINDPLNGFSGQHHAQEIATDDILLFDDGNEHVPPQSRAVEYKLDEQNKTATLIWSYEPSPLLYSFALGSVQRLSNGDTLIAFGTTSQIDEVDSEGNLVWQLVDEQPAFGFYRALFIDSLY